MAIQVLDRPMNLGAMLGAGLGQGAGSMVDQLLENKLKALASQQQRQESTKTFMNIPGMDPKLANFLSGLDPKQQGLALQNLPNLMQLFGGQQAASGAPLSTLGTPQMEGIESQQDQAQTIADAFTSPAEKRAKEALELRKEDVGLKRSKQLSDQYDKYTTQIKKYGEPAQKLYDVGNEILDILDQGKAYTGKTGKFLPTWLQSKEGQRLTQLLNEIVLLRDSALPGRNSVLRTKILQASKPEIWNDPSVIEKTISSMIDDKNFLKDLSHYQAYRELEDDFSTQLTPDFKGKLADKRKSIYKTHLEKDQLPPAAQFDGKVATNESTGEKFISRNGKWIPLDEE